MAPPYPTTGGALIPMPPDGAPYTSLSRSASERGRPRGQQQTLDVMRPGLDRARSTGYYDDEFWDRARDQHGGRRSHSRDGRRPHSQSHKERDLHLGVSLVGAVAGGFLGKKASKGDWKATVAGAVVGALGANVAEREWDRHKRKDDQEEDNWESKWGRRRS
jgi:Glycine zipper 2TM domain